PRAAPSPSTATPLVHHAQTLMDRMESRLPKSYDREALLGAMSIPLGDTFNVHEEVVRIRLSGDKVGAPIRFDWSPNPPQVIIAKGQAAGPRRRQAPLP